MKWYELLITDEFITYFSNPENEFYTKMDKDIEYAPLFMKFDNTIEAMTAASNLREYPEEFDYMFLGYKETLPYYYEAAVACRDQIPFPKEISKLYHQAEKKWSYQEYTVEELAVMIMYHFWKRGNYYSHISFLECGALKRYLLELKNKAKGGNNDGTH